MVSLSGGRRADVVDAFNAATRYLDGVLGVSCVYFDNMVSQMPFRVLAW